MIKKDPWFSCKYTWKQFYFTHKNRTIEHQDILSWFQSPLVVNATRTTFAASSSWLEATDTENSPSTAPEILQFCEFLTFSTLFSKSFMLKVFSCIGYLMQNHDLWTIKIVHVLISKLNFSSNAMWRSSRLMTLVFEWINLTPHLFHLTTMFAYLPFWLFVIAHIHKSQLGHIFKSLFA